MLIIDNFFDDVDSVLSLAHATKYYTNHQHPELSTGRWRGMRSEIVESNALENYIRNKTGIQQELILYFHYLTEQDVYNDRWKHIDSNVFKYAGVIYLNKNPDSSMGTIVGDKEVSNVFNRGVFYDANIIHSALGGFGNNELNSRLTLTVFFKYISVV